MTRSLSSVVALSIILILGCASRAVGQNAAPPVYNAKSPLGTNLGVLADYTAEWVFVDAFHASRPWISGTVSVWDDGRKVNTDANGWVASLEPGQVARTLMMAHEHMIPGNYAVLYDGVGTLEYGAAAALDKVQSRPGRHVLVIDPAKRGIAITITLTTSGNPIRNVRVIMPGGTCSTDRYRYAKDASGCNGAGYFMSFEANYAAIVFHPTFLERLRTYRAIRFMDWGRTNNSTQTSWSGRAKLTDARWFNDKGVPVEVMVDLANRLGADPWFNIPHLADDDYVRQYAKLVKQSLRTGLKAHLEYSNEVWNTLFKQAEYAKTQAQALGLGRDPFQGQLYFYSRRSVQIFDIWSAEFGDPSRLVRVMGSQAGSGWTSIQVLDFENASRKTDALAIAPYFGGRFGLLSEQNRVRAMTLDALFAELDTVSVPQAITAVWGQAAVARERKVLLLGYEGGQHLVGYSGVENDATINALFDAANRDPRMRDLYLKYLDGWRKNATGMMVHYVNAAANSKYGRWGALEYLDQPRALAPKYDALQTFIEQNPVSW